MNTRIPITVLLCIALAACGTNSRDKQDQSEQATEIAEPEPRIAEPEDQETVVEESECSTVTDTLQFVENYEGEDGFREFFLTKNYEILKMYPAEDPFEGKDQNKLFVISWEDCKYPDGRKERYLHNRKEISGAKPYMTRRHYSQDDGYTNIYEDTYQNATLKKVYGIILRNEVNFNYHLKEKLPKGNADYKSDERGDDVEITYRFKTSKHLIIELNYPGGITTVGIEESSGKTVSKITYSAD